MCVAGDTLNIFLLTGISNVTIFFIKMMNNVVVNSNIDDYFASKILTFNKKKNKNWHYTNKFIKNQHNIFPFKRVEDVCPLPGAGQNRPLPLLLPPHVQIEDDLLNGSPCPTWRNAKKSSWVRLVTHKLIVSVDAVVGVELFATTLAGKDIATMLPNFVLARHLQRLESFVTDITGVNLLSLSCALSPHTDSIQRQHDFPHKPALNTCRSSFQQMNTPNHVPLKADPCLETDVADDKADPSMCLLLNQISVLQYFLETAGSMDH